MNYPKLLLIFFILLTVFNTRLNSQIIIVLLEKPPLNQLKSENLWKLQLTNLTQNTYPIYLVGEVNEKSEGKIFEAISSTIELKPGTNRVSVKDIGKITISYSNKKYEKPLIETGTFPEGEYEICVTVINSLDKTDLGKGCTSHNVMHFNPPILIFPGHNKSLTESETANLIFQWLPPPQVVSGLSYKIKIVEVFPNQTPEIAIMNNPSWFEKNDIKTIQFKYPTSAKSFEVNKEYAWQVSAYIDNNEIAKSEIWNFSPGEPPRVRTFWCLIQDVSPKGCYNICCNGDTTEQKIVFRILHSEPIDLTQSGFSVRSFETCCGSWSFGASLSVIISNGWGVLNNIRLGTDEFIFYPNRVHGRCLCDGDSVWYQLRIRNSAGDTMLVYPYEGSFIVDLTGPTVTTLNPSNGSGVSPSGFTVNINVQDLPNCGANFSGVAQGFGLVELKDEFGNLIAKYISDSYFSYYYGDLYPPPVSNPLNWDPTTQTFSLNFPPTHFINPLPSPLRELRFCLTMWDDCGNLIEKRASSDGKVCLSAGEPFCWKYYMLDTSSCNWTLSGTPFKEKSRNPDTKVLIGGSWVNAYEIPCRDADCGTTILANCGEHGWGMNVGCVPTIGSPPVPGTCPWHPLYDRGACWVSRSNTSWNNTTTITSDIFKHDFNIPLGMTATNVRLYVLSDDSLHIFLDPPNPAALTPGTSGYITTQNGYGAPFGGSLIPLPDLSSGAHTLSFILVNSKRSYYGFIYGLDYDLIPAEDTTCDCGSWNSVNVSWNTSTVIVPRSGTVNIGVIPLGSNISVNTSYNCNPFICTPIYNWRVIDPAGFISAGDAIPFNITPTIAGTYFVTIIPKCGASSCDTFWFWINIHMIRDTCSCVSWGPITIDWLSSSTTIVTGTTFNPGPIPSGTTFTVNPSFNCNPPLCSLTFTWRLNLDGVGLIPTSSPPIAFAPMRTGVYTVIINPHCGLTECDATWFAVEITEIDTVCQCIGWSPINVSWLSTTVNATVGSIINISSIPIGTPITINANYNCLPPICSSNVNWRIFGGGTSWTGISTPIIFTPPISGEYAVYLTSICGGNYCDTIKFKIRIEDIVEECGCYGGDNFIISYDDGSFTTFPCGSTLTASYVGSSIAINRIIACGPTSLCPPNQNITIYKDGSSLGSFTGIELPYNYTFTSAGSYTFVLSGNCGTTRCDTCHFSINVSGSVSDTCICRDWRPVGITHGTSGSSVNCLPGGAVNFIDIGTIPVGTPINLTFYSNCVPYNCIKTYEWVITGPGGVSGTSTGLAGNVSFTPTASTTYDVILRARCDGVECPPCRFKIYVNLSGSLCDYANIEIRYLEKINLLVCGAPRQISINLSKEKKEPIDLAFIYTRAITDCVVIESPRYLITGPKGFNPISGKLLKELKEPRISLTKFYPYNSKGEPLPGRYDVIIELKANGMICQSCRFNINVSR